MRTPPGYSRRLRTASLLRGLFVAAALSPWAFGQIVDTRIPLNYNFHGMSHSAAITGGSEEWTAVADNSLADRANAMRSIADRSLIFDTGLDHSLAFYSGQSIGATGLSYAFFDTLGYGNTTLPDAVLNGLDIVHLGSRCSGFAPATNAAYEAAVNAATNTGTAPAWNVCDHTNASPQTTTFPELVIDPGTEIGILYQVSNGGGQFDVVLGFSDHAPITVRLAAPDWFGVPANPAILANQPVSSQAKLVHRVGGTSYSSFRGADNRDAPVIRDFVEGGGGPNLNVMEGIISVPRIIAGVGTFPPTPTIVGAHLNSITFQNATYPGGGRGYAIFAATLRSGQPERANCATPQDVTAGVTATSNLHTFGAAPSSCGGDDSSAVYYRYTAMNTGEIEARTCGAAFDTTLAVYDACNGNQLACDDNGCGSASRAFWSATANESYIIRVAGRGGAVGTFNLTIDDPAPTYTPLALNYNWNGMVHGAAEQGAENRDNANGYRSVADRGLLLSGDAAGIDAASPLVDVDFMPFELVLESGALDIVHLGDRRFVANAARDWGTAVNNGLQPDWLLENDQTTPQTTDLSANHYTFTQTTKLGVLYQISDGGGSFELLLNFAGGDSAYVVLLGPDWFGSQFPPAPAPFSGVLHQRQLGVYTGTQDTDVAFAPATALNVTEAVISVASLEAVGWPDFAGRELASIVFRTPFSNSNYPNSARENGSGFAILAATLSDVIQPPACPGDVDEDGDVDLTDLALLLTNFGTPSGATRGMGDLDGDGDVDLTDLATLLANFGTNCA